MSQMTGISVIIPAFNEERAIGEVIDSVSAALKKTGRPSEIIVVDDGSRDRTFEIAKEKGVRLLRHPIQGGYGSCLRDGILNARHENIVIIDGDGSYPAESIPEIVEPLSEFDMVIGARTGSAYRESLLKFPLRYIFQLLCEFVAGTRIPDANSGLRAFKKEAVLKFRRNYCLGFSFTTTITLAYHLNGYFVKYVPIKYHKRVGKSHVRLFRDSLRTTQIMVESILYYNPIKLFLLVSVLNLLIAGGFFYTYFFSSKSAAALAFGQAFLISGLLFIGMGFLTSALRTRHDLGKS